MPNPSIKNPLARSINSVATVRAADQLQLTGKDLPCSVVAVKGAVVQVKFEIQSGFTLPNVTVPVATSIYARAPTQVGDFGVVRGADAHLGGVSGLGGGTADLTRPGNLAALVFSPIGNAAWAAAPDPNAYLLQGPNGVILRDMAGHCVLTLTPSGIVIKVGSATYAFTAAMMQAMGAEINADGIGLKTHLSSGVQSGTGTSGPPVAGAAP